MSVAYYTDECDTCNLTSLNHKNMMHSFESIPVYRHKNTRHQYQTCNKCYGIICRTPALTSYNGYHPACIMKFDELDYLRDDLPDQYKSSAEKYLKMYPDHGKIYPNEERDSDKCCKECNNTIEFGTYYSRYKNKDYHEYCLKDIKTYEKQKKSSSPSLYSNYATF